MIYDFYHKNYKFILQINCENLLKFFSGVLGGG